MSNQPLISVIVPVYNVAAYLPRCLDSICKQTYPHLEVIVVDDGSTDNSLEICQQYAKQDKRFTVICQKNGGLSAARNTGMDNMHGEFFTFIDSDDWVSPDYCQVLLDLQQQTNACVAWGNWQFAHDNKNFSASPKRPDIFNLNHLTAEEYTLLSFIRGVSVCIKLYQSAVFKSLRFDPEYKLSEDIDFTMRSAPLVDFAAYTDKPLYFYYQRPSSLIHTPNLTGRKKILDFLPQVILFCKKQNWKRAESAAQAYYLSYGLCLTAFSLLEKSAPAALLRKKMHAWTCSHQAELLADSRFSVAGKMFLRCFVRFPLLTYFICNLPGIKKILHNHATQ